MDVTPSPGTEVVRITTHGVPAIPVLCQTGHLPAKPAHTVPVLHSVL